MIENVTRAIRADAQRRPSIVHVTLGQDRYAEHADPEPPRQPVGFAPPKTVVDPMVWEGDNA